MGSASKQNDSVTSCSIYVSQVLSKQNLAISDQRKIFLNLIENFQHVLLVQLLFFTLLGSFKTANFKTANAVLAHVWYLQNFARALDLAADGSILPHSHVICDTRKIGFPVQHPKKSWMGLPTG